VIVGSSSGPNWQNVIGISRERAADDSSEFVMALSADERRDLNEVNDALSRTATPGGHYDLMQIESGRQISRRTASRASESRY